MLVHRMQILIEVQSIFRDVFDDETLIISEDTDANDIEGWDSYAHIVILASIQDHYGIEFSTKEILGLGNVGDIISLIEKKL